MSEDTVATFNKNGYLTEKTLRRIRKWDTEKDMRGFLALVKDAWNCDFGTFSEDADPDEPEKTRLILVSGGWSGNEDVAAAMMGNNSFWSRHWRSFARGGRYVFLV